VSQEDSCLTYTPGILSLTST